AMTAPGMTPPVAIPRTISGAYPLWATLRARARHNSPKVSQPRSRMPSVCGQGPVGAEEGCPAVGSRGDRGAAMRFLQCREIHSREDSPPSGPAEGSRFLDGSGADRQTPDHGPEDP